MLLDLPEWTETMDVLAPDRKARTDLRNTLVSYMTGEIQSFEFDDQNTQLQGTKTTTDNTVRRISRFLCNIHDDFIDHPISVGPDNWALLRRIVAFLRTDLDIETTQDQPAWPFCDDEEWQQNERLLNESGLPEYDPAIHGRQVNPWWNRIPSSVGFVILGGLLSVLLIVLFLM